MVEWSQFLPDVLPHVPGCPSALAEHELKRSAQEFFKRTFAWRVDLPLLPALADEPTIDVVTGDDSLELVRVEALKYNGKIVECTTRATLDQDYGDGWEAHTGNLPHKWFSDEPAIVRLYPIPFEDAAQGVTINASVTPSNVALGLPANLFVKFAEPIYLGARARLMLYPNVPFNNPSMAKVYATAFDAQVGKYQLQKARSFSNARIPSRPGWC